MAAQRAGESGRTGLYANRDNRVERFKYISIHLGYPCEFTVNTESNICRVSPTYPSDSPKFHKLL